MIKELIYKISYASLFLVLINTSINLLDNRLLINFFDILMGIILFSFLFFVSKSINEAFNLKSFSFAIFIYLCSFFILDIAILFIYKSFLFNEIFLITNVIWLIFFLIKNVQKSNIFLIITSISILKFLFSKVKTNLTTNQNITGDVEAVFYGQSQNIFENSYYFSVNNYVMEGYPQFTSYLQALFLQFAQQNGDYNFYAFTSHIVFYLTILFFFEIKLSTFNKLLISAVFSSLVLNSKWISFLFTTSLMSEGIVSLFTGIGFYFAFYNFYSKKVINYEFLFYFITGFLYFTKQFNSSITLIIFCILFIFNKKNKLLLLGLSGILIKELLYLFVFNNVSKDHHIRQIDFIDTALDLVLFRDLKLINIISILKNLFIDKPVSLILLIFYLTIFLISYRSLKNYQLNTLLFFIVNLNLVLIFGLYISVWQNMELDSPIRYILNYLHLILISIFINLEKYKTSN